MRRAAACRGHARAWREREGGGGKLGLEGEEEVSNGLKCVGLLDCATISEINMRWGMLKWTEIHWGYKYEGFCPIINIYV